ncbi:MAG: site-specific integrase [Planctomycetaceae bacterium]|nr:site-specific integrase [Planctomycetaceae bacterium]
MATTDKKRSKTTRRGNGEGSIFQRGDGRWVATIATGYGADGKRRRKAVYGWTKKEVQDKLGVLLPQAQGGLLSDSKRSTLAEFLDRWLEDTVRTNKRASTYASYKQLVEKHVKPFIGGVQLARLSPANVGSLYATLERSGKSGRLRQMVHAVLHRALERAIKLGQVPRNVCDAVERPEAPRHEITPLTLDQTATFLHATKGTRLHALYILAIASGLRQGELFALRWDDIDLDGAVLSVRRTVVQIGKEFIINEPKTARGKRRVELPPVAIESLREHRKRMMVEGHAGAGWVFVSRNGQHLRRNVVRLQLGKILKAEKLPAIRFHDLRHTCASLLMMDGTHAKVVQERLGHSQISITLDTYSHVVPSMQRAAADRMDTMLRPTGS